MDDATVSTDRNFTILELQLIIEALRCFGSGKKHMVVKVVDEFGTEVGPGDLNGEDDFISKMFAGVWKLEAHNEGEELSEEELESIDSLAEMFTVGLIRAEEKQEKIISDIAKEGLPEVMAGIRKLLEGK